jgi:hypothetical protein
MKKPRFDIAPIEILLRTQKIATIQELKEALKTDSTMTVFRKLQTLNYLSSYSHRGKYYTLSEIPDFDELGLWSYQSVYFSKYGNLVETARAFVNESEAGFTSQELNHILSVESKQALLNLLKKGHIHREKMSGIYVYFSNERIKQRSQILLRQDREIPLMRASIEPEVISHELKAAIILFFSLLDEKQRRLYAGLEALKLGHGGDQKIAQLFGLDAHTVARGRRELFESDIELERVRKIGGGRKPVEKKHRKSSTK